MVQSLSGSHTPSFSQTNTKPLTTDDFGYTPEALMKLSAMMFYKMRSRDYPTFALLQPKRKLNCATPYNVMISVTYPRH